MDKKSKELQQEYQQRFKGADNYREAVWKILCKDFFSKYISKEADLLDLGAGWGEFSRNISARKKFAMDLNPDCGERIEGYSIFLQQDCSAVWPLEDGSIDVVFTSNFFEHLPSKDLIEKTLREAFRCLKSGGIIICLGPNIKYTKGLYWDYWDHHIPITEESMAEILSLSGFFVREKIDRFLPYTMSNGKKPPLLAIKIYLKIRFVWKYFGKQFLVVARKP